MGRRAASKSRSTPARSSASARYAAGSSWSYSKLPDVPLSHPEPAWTPVSVGQRPNPSLKAVRGRLTRTTPARGVSFGPWSLSLPAARQALVCARRGIRREVIFAKKFTGAGSYARKKYFSNRSCK